MKEAEIPRGEVLMIHPHYVHYGRDFSADPAPFLPMGLLYAGELLERKGAARTHYHDSQLHDLRERVQDYDSFGITVMGTQNIAPAFEVYKSLVEKGVDPSTIYVGGQGVKGLDPKEFERIFPGAHKVDPSSLVTPDYWDIAPANQVRKFSEEDLRTYLGNENTLLVSQGCEFGCTFCGADIQTQEVFYNTRENLEYILEMAKDLGREEMPFYCSSLDFFQQALKGGDIRKLEKRLHDMIELQQKYGIRLRLRALTRADSYLEAMESGELLNLVKTAGFNRFGIGADGAANVALLHAMRKGTANLHYQIVRAFEHAEENGFIPEILYVFGIPADTEETLEQTKDLCTTLLERFPSSEYRGFPAKNWIPGNANWKRDRKWKESEAYRRLLSDPRLFVNLGFESLASLVSHPDPEKRKLTNKYAIEMSHRAHQLGRVQSFLTVPIMETDGHEMMDEQSFELFREIARNYAPEIADSVTLENLPEYRAELNRRIPKDK